MMFASCEIASSCYQSLYDIRFGTKDESRVTLAKSNTMTLRCISKERNKKVTLQMISNLQIETRRV
jgi:hypothetical protein